MKKWKKSVGKVMEVKESKKRRYKGRGEEPRWIIKKEDYRNVKEGRANEKKQTGEAFRPRRASLWTRSG